MRDTSYATELKTSKDEFGARIERLYVKAHGREEIRFSWWKDGSLMMRPLDLPEDELLPLMRSAMSEGVFSQDFLLGLRSALEGHLSQQEFERYVETLRAEGRQPAAEPAKTDDLLALLATLEPIDEDWPEIDDPPPEPVEL